jgi:hypothetical protein
MRVRALIAVAVVAPWLAVGNASADTLFTSANHTTPVPAGTTASIASGIFTATGTSMGLEAHNQCSSSTLDLRIEQNNAAGVIGTFTNGSFSGCLLPPTGDFPWAFTVNGTGAVSGANTVFVNTVWHGLYFTGLPGAFAAGTLTGATGSPPANGVYVRQATSTGASICFELANAGTVSGPLLSDGRINATYCLEGSTATAWSLGATALPPVSPGVATLFTTSARTTRVAVGATGRLTGQGALGFTSGGSLVEACSSSTFTFQVVQNSDAARVVGTVTGGSLSGCAPFASAPTFPWTGTITGGLQVVGSTAAYPNTTLANLKYDGFGLASGTLAPATSTTSTGLYAIQPVGGGGPICLVMNHAGTVTDPLFGPLNLDGRYCFTGEPASTWSLT